MVSYNHFHDIAKPLICQFWIAKYSTLFSKKGADCTGCQQSGEKPGIPLSQVGFWNKIKIEKGNVCT
jgi:hypothetical protein